MSELKHLNLTEKDFDLMVEGLDSLPEKGMAGELLGDLFGSMLMEEDSEAKIKFENERDKKRKEKEMMTHLLSGEVTIPFTDAVNYVSELIEEANLPSQFKYGDKVLFGMQPSDGGWVCPMVGEIKGVHFYKNQVKYDLELGNDEERTRIYNVRSLYVMPYSEEAYKCYAVKQGN